MIVPLRMLYEIGIQNIAIATSIEANNALFLNIFYKLFLPVLEKP